MHIPSIHRNKGPLQISGKVAGCVVRTLKTFQGTHILGASRGLLCDSSAVLLCICVFGEYMILPSLCDGNLVNANNGIRVYITYRFCYFMTCDVRYMGIDFIDLTAFATGGAN